MSAHKDYSGTPLTRIARKVSKPVQSPYPPDEPGEPPDELGDLVDAVASDRDWANVQLQRVVFQDCRMEGCDFYGASMKNVLFDRCELREATFSSAMLERVELRDCDLTGLNGAEALRGARMPLNDVLANALMFAAVVGIEIAEYPTARPKPGGQA